MAPSMNEKSNAGADASSIRSTSTMSSLKALLPSKKSNNKEKPRSTPETLEQKATRREATAVYMSMR